MKQLILKILCCFLLLVAFDCQKGVSAIRSDTNANKLVKNIQIVEQNRPEFKYNDSVADFSETESDNTTVSMHSESKRVQIGYDRIQMPYAEPNAEQQQQQQQQTHLVVKWRDKRNDRQSLCDSECDCTTVNNFQTVKCDFLQNRQYILGPRKYIPKAATSLRIRLSDEAQLRIDEDFFYHNTVNRISIQGDEHAWQSSRTQVEVGPEAFKGNNGPFPEIEISNLFTVVIRTKAFSGEFKINISDCHDVIIFPEAFATSDFQGHFNNIIDLRPHARSFSKAQAKLFIDKCHIEQLLRLDTSLKEIRFTNSRIDKIATGAFDVLNINSIIFDRCTIGVIENKATTEKLYSKYLEISGCTIQTIESEAIAGSGIVDVILNGNTIETIQANAIYTTTITANISNNTIKKLKPDWFRVKDWSTVIVSQNKFGDFHQMTIERTANPVLCTFSQNSISFANENCLNFNSTHCHIREISFLHVCTCARNKTTWLSRLTSAEGPDIRRESYCTIDETLKDCYNTTLLNVHKFEMEICDASKKNLDCQQSRGDNRIKGDFIDLNVTSDKRLKVEIIYMILALSILLILITIIVCLIIRKIIKRRAIIIPVAEMMVRSSANNTCNMKASKSFSNDDRTIIKNTLSHIKQKHSPELYDQVYNYTSKLLQGNLTDSEKVLTIGDIIRNLNDCENTGGEFVAFTGILYNMLAPKDETVNANNIELDPIYAEPNLPNVSGGGKDATTPMPDYGQGNIYHIYAEPHSAQQPLLTNEYFMPLDKKEHMNVYSEPLPPDNAAISPYAIGNTQPRPEGNRRLHDHQEPSTSRNLPDVLQHPPSGSFSANPHFHMTRSPNTQRKIPKYAIINSNSKFKDDPNSYSDHSGGSDITYKIDDIEYADDSA